MSKFKQRKKATSYCVQFGRSLRSAISCQRKWLNITRWNKYVTRGQHRRTHEARDRPGIVDFQRTRRKVTTELSLSVHFHFPRAVRVAIPTQSLANETLENENRTAQWNSSGTYSSSIGQFPLFPRVLCKKRTGSSRNALEITDTSTQQQRAIAGSKISKFEVGIARKVDWL